MPSSSKRKTGKKNRNKKGGGEISTISNFTSSRNPTNVNVTGSNPRSSEGVKPAASTSSAPASATASAPASATAPASAASLLKSSLLRVPATAVSAVSAVSTGSSRVGLLIRYIIIFCILSFLSLTLYLYLEKPKSTTLSQLYDPVFKFFNTKLEYKKKDSALNTLAKTIDEKKVVNNIDNKTVKDVDASKKEKKYKKKPVIPEADDATSQTQMKPTSKAGYCYIGEDRGFRSCIEVGEGDVCMSGDIFPTQAICINPNLRE